MAKATPARGVVPAPDIMNELAAKKAAGVDTVSTAAKPITDGADKVAVPTAAPDEATGLAAEMLQLRAEIAALKGSSQAGDTDNKLVMRELSPEERFVEVQGVNGLERHVEKTCPTTGALIRVRVA